MLLLGKKSQECGLQVSLLERLHHQYRQHHSDKYTASLIRNYRCVPEILLLPSALYYESSLLCEVPNCRDNWYPLQFICSSVEDICSSSDSSEAEAEVVVSEVIKYLSSHQNCKVCIASPSPAQVRLK